MAIEIGACCTGRVTRIAAYGVFVALDADGTEKTGMIHISELSPCYVRDIAEWISVGDPVCVRVLSVDARGRIALSRRQAMTEEEAAAERAAASHHARATPPAAPTASAGTASDFEDMMRRYRAASEETLASLHKSRERGGRRTKGKRSR